MRSTTLLKPVIKGSDATGSNSQKNEPVKSDDLDGTYLVDVSADGHSKYATEPPSQNSNANERQVIQSNDEILTNDHHHQIKDIDTGNHILPEIAEEEEEENLIIKTK